MAENTIAVPNQETQVATQEDTREPRRFVAPVVDIYENEEGLVVVADMPGLDKDDVTVSTEQDVLTIRGVPGDQIDREYVYREFEPVGYFREFRLGNKIDQAKIKAEYKNGVLNLNLPFAEEVKPRKIDVKVG